MVSTSNECQLQFVLQTFEKDLQLSVRETIRLYNIPHSTLSIRINGVSTHVITIANSRKLTALEKEVIVRKILDLDSRRFLPRIHDVEDIADCWRYAMQYTSDRVGLPTSSNNNQSSVYIGIVRTIIRRPNTKI